MRLVLLFTLLACDADKDTINEEDIVSDKDGDGQLESDGDCNDNDATTFGGAEEICDGIDNDCDGEIDEELQQVYYVDADNDGFGDDSQPLSVCDPDIHVSEIGGDCNDQDPSITPNAFEVCDGVDNDCDGQIDNEAVDARPWYEDQDEDGYGNPEVSTRSCEEVSGYVDNNTDCNDLNATISPSAQESCDGKDNDCDGQIDEADAIDISIWYADDDEDGFGDVNAPSIACEAPTKHVSNTQDCDDQDPNIHPNADEECDGFDNNCDGQTDGMDAIDVQMWYQDADGDGYGDVSDILEACSAPSGYVADNTDCDDSSGAMHPGLTETCDGIDNNCDGQTDEGVLNTYFLDADEDGYGDSNTTTQACSATGLYVENADDCNDLEPLAYTGAVETCDGVDNNCDGETDEGVQNVYYLDVDGDGYGTASMYGCTLPSGYADLSADCDDDNSSVYPSANEVCDGIDNNCDGFLDDEDPLYDVTSDLTYYLDNDGDGFGDDSTSMLSCASPGAEYVLLGEDCDDQNVDISPDALEECNEIDDNCDGEVDEDYIDETGLYSFDDHCGSCNTLCDDEIPNGIGQCVIDATNTPYCEVSSCDAGYTMFPNAQGCGLEITAYQAQGRPGFCGWSTSPTYCSSDSSLLGSCWQNGSVYGSCIIGYDCPNTANGDTSFSVSGPCSSYF